MVTLSPETQERIREYEAYRRRRLLARADALFLYIDRDEPTGGWAVRSPQRLGYVELVTAAGCTCREYRLLGNCPHAAMASLIETNEREAA